VIVSRRIASLALAICAMLGAGNPALAAEPVGSWRLDQASGNVAVDDGPFGLDGMWPATAGPEWIAGVAGTALRFDGDEQDEVAIAEHRALEPATVTVAAWVRRTGSPGAHRYVFSKGAATCAHGSYGLYTGPEGGAAFYVAGDGWFTLSPQVPEAAVWDGRWHRLVGAYDGARVRLYLDGDEVGAGIPGPTQIEYGLAGRASYIGTYRGPCGLQFQGDVDEVAVWGEALSATRIRADAAPPAETPASGPIGRAPGAPPPADPDFGAVPGARTTPAGCTSVSLSRRTLRAARNTRLFVTVRRGRARHAGARVVVRARKLHKIGRTNARGRVRFVVRPSRADRRVEVSVRAVKRAECGRPVAQLRVRR
jgi:hypothetical protein